MSTAKNIFLVLPIATFAVAEALANDPVSFVMRSWDAVNRVVVDKDTSVTDYVVLTGVEDKITYTLESNRWYVVKGDFGRKNIYAPSGAAAHLIICDGAKLTGRITIEKGHSLYIYGQKNDSGKIDVKGEERNIGDPNVGVKPMQSGRKVYDAAIGGVGDMGELVVYGGNITARSGHTYYSNWAAGIGGGSDGSGGTITVYGGTIKAYGGKDAAGIGSGEQQNGKKHGGSLTVYGGMVEAHGGAHGAGIGGGQDASGAVVTIYGGTVRAYGGVDAAGIGSGEEFDPSVSINGGSLTVYGGDVFADGTGWGAGIGGGEDSDGADVKIYGGKVVAWAGADAGKKNGSAIGSEDGDGHYGKLYIADGLRVWAGQSAESTSLFPYETRVPACRWRPYARIEPDLSLQQVGNILKKSAVSDDARIREGKLDAVHSIGRRADCWFDMQGRRLNGRPTDQGKYLHNGRVEVVR